MLTTAASHEQVTGRIIKAIADCQTPPWRRPISDRENDGFPTCAATMRPFSGVNVLLLILSAQEQGFHSRFWSSENDWASLDSTVSGQPTILADGISVFNADQTILSLGSVAYRSRRRAERVAVDYAQAEAVIKASGADVRHDYGQEAAYYYAEDFVIFPMKWQFEQGKGGIEAFWDSLFHEVAGHWTEPRLGWTCTKNCVRELRAEIAAPFITAQLGLPVLSDMKLLPNHRKHLARWVRAMKQDPNLIFQIASDASEAVAYLLSLKG